MTRRSFSFSAFLAAAVMPLLSLTGCSTATVLGYLQDAVEAVTLAISAVSGVLNLGPIMVLILNYLEQASTAISTAATILANSALSAEQKAIQIIAAFVGAVAPDLTGVPAMVANAIAAVVAAIGKFLAGFHVAAGASLHGSAMPAKTKAILTTLTNADRELLVRIQAKSAVNLIAVAKLRGSL